MSKHIIIGLVGVGIWLIETAFFGFHPKPINGIEGTLDMLSAILIVWGITGDILSGVQVHKNYTFNSEDLHYHDNRGADAKTKLNVPVKKEV